MNYSTVLVAVAVWAMQAAAEKLHCDDVTQDADMSMILSGKELVIGLYSGELSLFTEDNSTNSTLSHSGRHSGNGDRTCDSLGIKCVEGGVWSGFDIELMDKLAHLGNFSYSIKFIGHAVDIGNYTHSALTVLGDGTDGGADLMGQGTWRWNSDRAKWAVWTSPVVSEQVQFVTKGPDEEKKEIVKRFFLLFKPFKEEVWILLVVIIFGYTWMLKYVKVYEHKRVQRASVAANTWLSKVRRKSSAAMPRKSMSTWAHDPLPSHHKIAYNTCVSCIGVYGSTHTDPQTNALRYINVGWIFFSYLLATVYASNLTAHLTLRPEMEVAVAESVEQCAIDAACNFCVQDGAANEAYFRKTYSQGYLSLNIVEKKNIEAQITGIIDGSCHATELTTEDLFQWAKRNGTPAVLGCTPQITGLPIVRRNRGMMAKMEKSCHVTAINAIYAKFSTAEKGNDDDDDVYGMAVNAVDLNKKYFSPPACESKLSAQESYSMSFVDLGGAFIVLLIVLVYGVGTLLYGRRMKANARSASKKAKKMVGNLNHAVEGFKGQVRQRAASIARKKAAKKEWEKAVPVDVVEHIREVVEGGFGAAGDYHAWMSMTEEEWHAVHHEEMTRTAEATHHLLSNFTGVLPNVGIGNDFAFDDNDSDEDEGDGHEDDRSGNTWQHLHRASDQVGDSWENDGGAPFPDAAVLVKRQPTPSGLPSGLDHVTAC